MRTTAPRALKAQYHRDLPNTPAVPLTSQVETSS